jgi:hypothetical protein
MKAAPRKDLAICKVSSPTETPVTVQGSRNPDSRIAAAMRETFRAALAAGLSRSEAADLVMSTMLAGVVGAALSDADRARLTMSVQAETRNLVVGIQAGRARRAA